MIDHTIAQDTAGNLVGIAFIPDGGIRRNRPTVRLTDANGTACDFAVSTVLSRRDGIKVTAESYLDPAAHAALRRWLTAQLAAR